MKNQLIVGVLGALIAALLLFSCSVKLYRGETTVDQLEKLADWMTGSFSSEDQARLDTNFYAINMEMSRIWPERKDGYWLYVEQSASWSPDKPYRQRVYQLSQSCGIYTSRVFTIPDPLRFAGRYDEADLLSGLVVDSLTEKTGCAINMSYSDCSFTGKTEEMTCESALYGAAYASSEVMVTRFFLHSLDRGFDSAGKQVWGSEFGPYQFKKLKDRPLE